MSKLFINKINSIKKERHLKNSLSYNTAVQFSINDDEFPPLLSCYTPLHPRNYNSTENRTIKYFKASIGNTFQPGDSVKTCNPMHPVNVKRHTIVRKSMSLPVCKPIARKPVSLPVCKPIVRKPVSLPISKPVVRKHVSLHVRKPVDNKNIS